MKSCIPTIVSAIVVALYLQVASGEPPREPAPAHSPESKSSPEATGSDVLQVSSWGEEVQGLQCRIHIPRSVEQGLPLPVTVDFRKGGEHPFPLGEEGYIQVFDHSFSLILSRDGTKLDHILDSDNYKSGMPVNWSPYCKHYTRQIKRQGMAPVQHRFHLAKLGERLLPGTYTCRLRFHAPDLSRDCDKGWEDGKPDPLYWGGELISHPVRLEVLAEKLKTKEFLLPKRLRLFRQSFPTSKPYLVVNYTEEDAERLEFRVRNGHYVGTRRSNSKDDVRLSWGLSGGPPRPNAPNAVVQLHGYKGGPIDLSVEMELFETCESTGHFWSPGNCGYKTLWKRTFKVEYTELEAQAILSAGE